MNNNNDNMPIFFPSDLFILPKQNKYNINHYSSKRINLLQVPKQPNQFKSNQFKSNQQRQETQERQNKINQIKLFKNFYFKG